MNKTLIITKYIIFEFESNKLHLCICSMMYDSYLKYNILWWIFHRDNYIANCHSPNLYKKVGQEPVTKYCVNIWK